jgi:hypothetical protein
MRNFLISSILLSLASAAHAQPAADQPRTAAPGSAAQPTAAQPTADQPTAAQPVADEGVVINEIYGYDNHGYLHENWLPFTSSGMRLESDDFYQRVGRPDLVAAHDQRRTIAIGTAIGGLAVTGATLVYAVSTFSNQPAQMSCNVNSGSTQFTNCVNANLAADQAHNSAVSSAMPWVIGGSVVGVAVLAVSGWYFLHPEPIDEAQAQQLAAAHNTAIHVTPYASTTGGGLSLAGHF